MDSDTVKAFKPKILAKQQDPASSSQEDASVISFPPDLPTTSLQQQLLLSTELVGRAPLSHYWDTKEPRVLVVEWSGLKHPNSELGVRI